MNGVFSTLLHLLSLGSFGPSPDSTGFNFRSINDQEDGRSLSVNQNSLAAQSLSLVDLLTSGRFGREKRVAETPPVVVVDDDLFSKFYDFAVALLNSDIWNARLFSRLLSILVMLPIFQLLWQNKQMLGYLGSDEAAIYFVVLVAVASVFFIITFVDAFVQVPEDTIKGQILAGLILIGTVAAGVYNFFILNEEYHMRLSAGEQLKVQTPQPSTPVPDLRNF